MKMEVSEMNGKLTGQGHGTPEPVRMDSERIGSNEPLSKRPLCTNGGIPGYSAG